MRRPETRRGGTGRPRPASAVRKTVAAHTLADARSRGEYGCAWATDVRRTDAPVVVWDLRGSQGPNSPRGIAAPVFPLRCASLIRRTKRRLRSAWPAPDGRGRPAPARRGRAASPHHTPRRVTTDRSFQGSGVHNQTVGMVLLIARLRAVPRVRVEVSTQRELVRLRYSSQLFEYLVSGLGLYRHDLTCTFFEVLA